jgi:hypothetical protein
MGATSPPAAFHPYHLAFTARALIPRLLAALHCPPLKQTVFRPHQLLIAQSLGAEYAAPYLGRMKDAEGELEVVVVRFGRWLVEVGVDAPVVCTLMIRESMDENGRVLALACLLLAFAM